MRHLPTVGIRVLLSLGLLLPACGGTSTQAAVFSPLAEPVMQRIRAVLQREESRFVEIRRDLHRHPELSGQESRTAGIVAAELHRLGLEVRTGVGGHGVTGLLRGARPGPVIAYRADMDAVNSTAPDPVDFRSLTPGVRHICGHDIHTVVGLALANVLRQVRDSLAGSVLFVFQPAEERATGARAMLADDVFRGVAPVAIYGVHTAPMEQGRIATTPGPMMAGRDRFEVVLTGNGDLSSAVATVTQRIAALGTTDAVQLNTGQPPDFVYVQLAAPSVTAGQARLSGVISVASAASRSRVQDAIRNGLASAIPSGITVTATYEARWVAGVTNDTTLALAAFSALHSVMTPENIVRVTTIPAAFSEDFGSFQERVPGVFFYLGVSNSARGWTGQPHSPDYVADERAITTGTLGMAAVIQERQGRP